MTQVVSSVSTRSEGRVRVGCSASGNVRTTLANANRPAAIETSRQRTAVRVTAILRPYVPGFGGQPSVALRRRALLRHTRRTRPHSWPRRSSTDYTDYTDYTD